MRPSDRQVALGGRGLFDPVTSTRLLSTTELVALAILTPVLSDIEESILDRIALVEERGDEKASLIWHDALNLVRGR